MKHACVSLSRIHRHGQFLSVALCTFSLSLSSTIWMIYKSNRGSFALELAYPSSWRGHPLTNPVGIKLSTQTARTQLSRTRNFKNTVLTSHQEIWSKAMGSVCVAVLVFGAYGALRPEECAVGFPSDRKIRVVSPLPALW